MTDPQHRPTEQFPAATPPAGPDDGPTALSEPAPRSSHPRGRKRVALVAAFAVAALAVGGGSGFAVGRATAPEAVTTSTTSSTSTTDPQVPGGGPGGWLGTPPEGGPLGTLPGRDGGSTGDGTTDDGTTEEPTA